MWSNRIAAALSSIALCACLAAGTAGSAELYSIVVVPENGQSPDRARRDRFECHNWALAQTGAAPPSPAQRQHSQDIAKAERVDRVIAGASIGAAIGGLTRSIQHESPSEGLLAGSAIGAAVGAFTGRKRAAEREDTEFDSYYRALSACLEARQYAVSLPDDG